MKKKLLTLLMFCLVSWGTLAYAEDNVIVQPPKDSTATQLLTATALAEWDKVNLALLASVKAAVDGNDTAPVTDYVNSVVAQGLVSPQYVFATDIAWVADWYSLDMFSKLLAISDHLTFTGLLSDGSTYDLIIQKTLSIGNGVKRKHETYTAKLTITRDGQAMTLLNTSRLFYDNGERDWNVAYTATAVTASGTTVTVNKTASKGSLVAAVSGGFIANIISNKSELYRYNDAGTKIASIKFEHLDSVGYTITDPATNADAAVILGSLSSSFGSAGALRGSICPPEPPPTTGVMAVTYQDASGNTITVNNGDLVPNNVLLTAFLDYKAAFRGQAATELLLNGERYAISDAATPTTLTATLDTSTLAITNITLTARALDANGASIRGSEVSLFFTVGQTKTPPPGDTTP